MSGRPGVAQYYPRRAVKDGHAWMSPDVLKTYRRFSLAEIFEPLFRFRYVGRVGLEPTTGGL